MNVLFQPSYWLTMSPPEVGGLLGTIVFTVFVSSLVLGIIGRIVSDRQSADRYKREIGNKIATLLVTMGILGVVLYFFSYEGIQLFGARFWYPLWVIMAAVWVYYIVRYVKHEIPQQKAVRVLKNMQDKYLPKSKKKRKKHRKKKRRR